MTCDGMRPDEIARRVNRTGRTVRAWLRHRWHEQMPGQGGEWYLRHDQVQETLAHFGASKEVPGSPRDTRPRTATPRAAVAQAGKRLRARAASDEAYVIGLVGELVGETPLVGHRFDWLRGDAGTTLPVDAYFPRQRLVLEYRERQHLVDRPDSYKLWDNKPTVSGVPRREQRSRYDQLRDVEVPRHGLRLLIVEPTDLSSDTRGRLRREREQDLEALRLILNRLKKDGGRASGINE
jgi:hypothetical protein